MTVLTEMRNRGVRCVFFLACDGLKDFPKVVGKRRQFSPILSWAVLLDAVALAGRCYEQVHQTRMHDGGRPWCFAIVTP